jgi:HAD superfamily hydrolase (TIGR01509 family)
LKNVQGVIFDKDGTITDAHLYWGKIIELRAIGILSFYELKIAWFDPICYAMGWDINKCRLRESGPVGTLSRNDVLKIVKNYLKLNLQIDAKMSDLERISDDRLKDFMLIMEDFVVVLPGVVKFLSELKEHNIPTALITMDSIASATKVLELLGLSNHFDVVYGRESFPESKETGGSCKKAMAQLDLDPRYTIAIGDAPVDMDMAHNAGLKACVGVSTGQTLPDTLKKKSLYVTSDLSYLKIKGCESDKNT